LIMYRRVSPLLRSVRLQQAVKSPAFESFGFAATRSATGAVTFRRFSSEPAKGGSGEPVKENSTSSEVMKYDSDEYDDYEPQTKQEKVSYYGAMFLRLSLLLAGAGLALFTLSELFTGRMSANHVFSEVFDLMQMNDQVRQITGDGMKAFGRDTGRNTEGRRNHIDSFKYKAEDGSNRIRVRFNIKGNKGQVHVWVEISDEMPDNEYVYIVCQNARSGRVLTVVDNREELAAGFYAKKNEDSVFRNVKNQFSNLFSSGTK